MKRFLHCQRSHRSTLTPLLARGQAGTYQGSRALFAHKMFADNLESPSERSIHGSCEKVSLSLVGMFDWSVLDHFLINKQASP